MSRWLLLLAVPLLGGLAAPRSDTRFDAAGRFPDWRLKIEHGKPELLQVRPRKARFGMHIDKVERAAGKVRIDGTYEDEQLAPIGRGANGKMIVIVESWTEKMSIEVVETPCVDARRHRIYPTKVAIVVRGGDPWTGCGDSLAILDAGLIPAP